MMSNINSPSTQKHHTSMKKINTILAIVLFCTMGTTLFAQDTIAIRIISQVSSEGHVKLRWQPTNAASQALIQQEGINIHRKTVNKNCGDGDLSNPATYTPDPSSSDPPLSDDDQQAQVVIVQNFMPIGQSDLYNHAIMGTGDGQAAYELLYGTAAPVLNGSPFANAVTLQKSTANKFTFVGALAARNYELAKLLAWGIEDDLACPGTYTYIFNIGNYRFECTVAYESGINPYLAPPYLVSAEGGDQTAVITYDQTQLKQGYIGYYFERSLDSLGQYAPLNTVPYIYSRKSGTEDSGNGFYQDSLPLNKVKYYYRIRATNLFGNYSPYSNIISVKGIPPRLPISPVLGVKLLTEQDVVFRIPAIPAQYQSKISQIQLFKSADVSEGYIAVDGIILASDTLASDAQLIGSMYYILTYVDENGHYYRSNTLMVQAKDVTPPLAPKGLAAIVSQDGTIKLEWKGNEEYDLAGYRLYRSNGRNETYIDVTGQGIQDTTYIDFLPNNVLIDSAYYKMIAYDYRGNYSAYSLIAGISRPDKLAPANPVLFSGIGTSEGIYLKWEPSYSSDVVRHAVERSSPTEAWSEILSFTPKDQQYYTAQQNAYGIYNYIDNYNLLTQQYSYRLIAYDDNGNISSSGIITVLPMATIVEGKITWIDEFHTCDPTLTSEAQSKVTGISQGISTINASGTAANVKNTLLQLLQSGFITISQYQTMSGQPSTIVSQDLLGISTGIIANDKKKCYINVKWHYVHKDVNDETRYEIYRAVGNFTFDLYKTLKHSELEVNDATTYKFTDTAVQHGRKYSYKILALNTNNTSSKISNTVSAILE
jgi:fibronectin type 3 domain-containing protein